MSDSRPAPLVPAEVDLRDFAFMPLDVQRLRDSDLASDETPEACWAAVLLWCASWHQVPAGSIPDSDEWQAKHAGYKAQGRIAPAWRKVKTGALRGWVACTDGRLYHPVIAEKAVDAWRSKLRQRWQTECSRIKKHNQRHGMSLPIPEFEAWMSSGCPQGQALPVPEDTPPESPGSPGKNDSKGQGEGQGQGQGDLISEASASGAAAAPPIPPTDRDLVFANGVTLLTAAGVSDKNARSFLAAQCKAHGERAVRLALERCATERPIEPVPWLVESLKAAPAGRSASKPDRIAAQNADVVRRFAERNPQ